MEPSTAATIHADLKATCHFILAKLFPMKVSKKKAIIAS